VPCHAGDRFDPHAGRGLGRRQHGPGDDGEHVVLVGERHLCVELHELELAIGAQVFVAQAPGDLEVAVEAADHEELLEELRALRQGVERAGLEAGGNDEVARSLRGRCDEHRRLDLDEALLLHRPPDGAVDRGAQAQVALHARPA
jgi:hypothetical protein